MGGVNSTFGFRKFDVTCHNGNNGMAMLCVFADDDVSSDPDVKVIWRRGSKIIKSTGYNNFHETSDLVTGLSPGKYSVETIINDNRSSKRYFTIKNPPPIVIKIKTIKYPDSNVGKGIVRAIPYHTKGRVKCQWQALFEKKTTYGTTLRGKTGVYQVKVTDGRGCNCCKIVFLKPKTVSPLEKCKSKK